MATITIFLHGIGSSSDTWSNFINVLQSDSDTSEIEEYTPNSTGLRESGAYYYLYDYESKIIGNGNIVSKLKESWTGTKDSGNISIDRHVDSLKSFISLNFEEFSEINIVAHSLGGVLAMKLLLKIRKISEITNKLDSIMLYGVPLKGSNDPNELKKALGKNIPTKILQELSPKSITITSLNQLIERKIGYLKSSYRILYIKGNADSRIVEVDDAYLKKIGNVESIKGGHSKIINPENINDDSFIHFKRFICEHKKKLKKIRFKASFSAFLQSVDILEKSHPNKDKVVLDDIYVYPKMESYYNLKLSKKNIDAEELIEKIDFSKALIAGESQSGKTSLCKKYIEQLRLKGLIPVYLSADRNPYQGRIEKKLISAFDDQYEGYTYNDIPIKKIVPILDDFHLAKKKDRHITDLIKYPNVLIIVDDLFSLNLSQDNILRKYKHYKIKEYSPTLRNRIIKKWMNLSGNTVSDNESFEILDNKSELVENSLGKVMGNGVMPSYPFFILTIISTFETFEKPLDQEITSQGHCYQALIYLYLKKENIKNEDIDTYINFLTEFAYFLYKGKKREVSIDELNIFIIDYKEQYNLTVKKEVLLKKLNKVQIISLDSFNNYSFSYPYLQYFFVAKFISEHRDKETSILVDDLIDNLHNNENAYILSFVSHHSKDDFFLNKLLSSANDLYGSYDPSTLCTKEL